MTAFGARLLYALGRLLQLLSQLILAPGWVLLWMAKPVVWGSRRCLAKAREWDPDLWAHGQPTDLRPPP